jgi:hypothetical protein
MRPIVRTLLALALLLFAAPASAAIYGIGTPESNVSLGKTVKYMEVDTVLPPNPHNPSTSAKYSFQLQIHPTSPAGDGIYFAATSTTLTLHGRGYQVEIVTDDNGVKTDPFISCTAFPGDGVSWYYHGEAATPYVQIVVNNASGVNSGPCNVSHNYTPAHAPTNYLTPEALYQVSTAAGHNCTGDMPASNVPSHVSEQWFYAYLLLDDFTEIYPAFDAITFENPNLSPAGCDLAVSGDGAGNLWVDSYGW